MFRLGAMPLCICTNSANCHAGGVQLFVLNTDAAILQFAVLCVRAAGQPLRRSNSGGSSLAAAAAAAAEDELTLLRINADNTLLLDSLERQAPRSVRNTVSYLEVRLLDVLVCMSSALSCL
jgi:hypothetical protein